MPTINQLVRQGRKKIVARRNALALHSSLDSLHRKKTDSAKGAPFKQGVCLKVKFLRPQYDNLEDWCKVAGNISVTRRGRVFVTIDNDKHVFTMCGLLKGNATMMTSLQND